MTNSISILLINTFIKQESNKCKKKIIIIKKSKEIFEKDDCFILYSKIFLLKKFLEEFV